MGDDANVSTESCRYTGHSHMPQSKHSLTVQARFSVLMDELLRTGLRRARIERWELDLLLDIEACPMSGAAKRTALREYQNAVEAELESGTALPMRFSDFLKRRATPQATRKAINGVFPLGTKAKARTL